MKYIYILFLLLGIIGGFCSTKKEGKKMDDEYLILQNETLKDNIKQYYNKHLSEAQFEHILTIDFTQDEDTSIFVISYEMNLFALINDPPFMYFEIDNIAVALRNNLGSFFKLSSKYREEKMTEHFPSQFNAYKKSGEIPPPTTFRCDKWILKFKNNDLISKEIIK